MVLFVINTFNFNKNHYDLELLRKQINFESYVMEEDQNIKILSFFLKIYLIQYLEKKNLNLIKEIKIIKDKYYKPHLQVLYFDNSSKNFFFNISHDRGRVVLYWDNDHQVGIDILNLNRNIKISSLKNILHKDEQDFLNNCSVKDRKKNFFKIWTFKEAYLKFKGTGINNSKQLSELNFRSINIEKQYNFKNLELNDYIIGCVKKNKFDNINIINLDHSIFESSDFIKLLGITNINN